MAYIDGVPVKDEQEALQLMLHHLRLAAMLFEATPKKWPRDIFEDEFSQRAMSAWQTYMEGLYPED